MNKIHSWHKKNDTIYNTTLDHIKTRYKATKNNKLKSEYQIKFILEKKSKFT